MHCLILSFTITLVFFAKATKSDILVYARDTNQIIEEFHDLPARFGGSYPKNGLRVLAVHSNPSNACSPIEAPPKDVNKTNNAAPLEWAVLIARYDCSFELKVRNAQAAGYQAAIIYNLNSNDLEEMSANNNDGIDIRAMFVGETTGKIIIYNYQYNENFALVLNDELPFNINTHLILPFSVVVGLCFIIMIGFMIMKCVREQRRLRRHRLPGSVLKKIPIIRFSKEQHVALYEICAICLDDYEDGDKLRVLPCAHAYHNKCIDPWLTKNRRVCPMCKRKVFARGEPRQRRRRRSSDDSLSDSDHDDTTPLLNPVDHSNHGTFTQSDSDATPSVIGNAERTTADYPQQRQNPFDRQVNLPVANDDINTSDSSFWSTFISIFRTPIADVPQPDDGIHEERDVTQSNSNENDSIDVLIAPSNRSSSSNNILNSNLSGSFKKCQKSNDRNQQLNSAADDDDDDDEDYEDCTDQRQTIFAPISTSQPTINPFEQHRASDNASTSHQRIAVAALPNLNFHNPSSYMSRAVSSSSPSIYSVPSSSRRQQQQPQDYNNSNSADDDNNSNRSASFNRTTAASSSDYFV